LALWLQGNPVNSQKSSGYALELLWQTVHLIDSSSAENINNLSSWAPNPEQDSVGSFL
jgi:hypothetical protein